MTIIETVPNISEGRRADVLEALGRAVQGIDRVSLLDLSSDPSHNRSVLTLAGEADGLVTALLNLYAVAIDRIDMSNHTGVHPRIGAVDVVPFVPLHAATMDDCVALAHRLAHAVSERFEIPVYLYGNAARRPERRALEEIRRGQFETLKTKMTHAEWRPDFGPTSPHPTAGASAIGARSILIAFNVNLDTEDLDIARQIARTVRERDGGLPGVKALGVRLPHLGLVQVSTNVLDYERSPLHRVFARIEREATKRGVGIVESEIVGLVPAHALYATAASVLRLGPVTGNQVIESRLCPEKGLPRDLFFGAS